MDNNTYKFQCPFCKVKSEYTPKELSDHFLQIHTDISPDKMTNWFKSKSQSKIDQKKNKVNRFKGYDKKLKNSKSKKWIKVIYTPMGNKR
jgi:hypothetical protein